MPEGVSGGKRERDGKQREKQRLLRKIDGEK